MTRVKTPLSTALDMMRDGRNDTDVISYLESKNTSALEMVQRDSRYKDTIPLLAQSAQHGRHQLLKWLIQDKQCYVTMNEQEWLFRLVIQSKSDQKNRSELLTMIAKLSESEPIARTHFESMLESILLYGNSDDIHTIVNQCQFAGNTLHPKMINRALLKMEEDITFYQHGMGNTESFAKLTDELKRKQKICLVIKSLVVMADKDLKTLIEGYPSVDKWMKSTQLEDSIDSPGLPGRSPSL